MTTNQPCRIIAGVHGMLASSPHAFRRSSVVERAAVNRLVVGSNPTAGATQFESSFSDPVYGHYWRANVPAVLLVQGPDRGAGLARAVVAAFRFT